MRRLLRWLVRIALAAALLIVLLLLPVGYVETFCGGKPETVTHVPLIAEPQFRRVEANSYMTYPEWHIVYAYQGLAEVLKTGDEHAFGYLSSIGDFWSSACALSRVAAGHGGGDFATRATMHTIGVSFTAEMAMKALYEETLGRLLAWWRGKGKTPQDEFAAAMALDYGRFLEQVPWYKYDFDGATAGLWELPAGTLRGWERRLALGGEWKAKAAYARLIASAVDTVGQAQLTIRSAITGMLPSELLGIEGIDIADVTPDHVIIETPRYRAFTNILKEIAARGGAIAEIAGNDAIMISVLSGEETYTPPAGASLIINTARQGFSGRRHLLDVPVARLAEILRGLAASPDARLEHVYDY